MTGLRARAERSSLQMGGRTALLILALVGLGFGLRVAYLTVDRFHADEALYAGWALLVWEGDPWLLTVPVDKPPLLLYTLALCARWIGSSEALLRLPNVAASTVGIALAYRLGRQLYGQSAGAWTALLVALCPFDILFARTAFTDPMLVLWSLAALLAASRGRWFPAGLWAGLAYATKQHAILLLPLIVATGAICDPALRTGKGRRSAARLGLGVLGLSLPYALVTWWDAARWSIRPGFWEQSAQSYGGLTWAAPEVWGQRLGEWLFWARYLYPAPLLIAALGAGVPLLLASRWRRRRDDRRVWIDAALAAYVVGYVLAHVLLRFSIWDRYLLPLAVPLALLLARTVLAAPGGVDRLLGRSLSIQSAWRERAGGVLRALWTAAVVLSALVPAWRAAHNGYPVGGEHWAYQGLEQVVDYFRRNAPPGAVLYHHWLRWHYEYYMRDLDLELRWWESGEHLAREALRTPDRAQYIVLPDWAPQRPQAEGVVLRPLFDAHRQDGSVSMRVFRVEVSPAE